MEIVDKVRVATALKDLKVWQYAKCIELLSKQIENNQEGVMVMCEVLELCTDKPAHIWREQYKMDFTVDVFNKVKAVVEQPLPSDECYEFVFTTLTPEDFTVRKDEVRNASFWRKGDLRTNLTVDCNRRYQVEKTMKQTFEQVIQTEMLLKEIVRLDADVTIKIYSRLPRLLAFVCKLDSERFHYLDENDRIYKFNYALIDYREKVFTNLDIETAWRAYLAFFLTVRQNLDNTNLSGKLSERELKKQEPTGKNTLNDGA